MLVPRNAQEPEVLKEEFGLTGEDQPESFTVFDASVPRAITIVRIRKIDLSRLFKQSKNIANLDFAREVCQQNYRIVVQNRSGRIITDENQTAYAQKLFCESIGALVTLRSLNVSYKSYLEFAKSQSLIPYSQESYITFPVTGAVIN